jgi:hypothetical protein
MADRLLVPKKKRPKSKWMQGWSISPPLTDMDKVAQDRMELCRNIRIKRQQRTGH